ncbi:MAG TPA: thiamine phosphate synthase [Candidatus Polarisedimenticolia bacterium]|nr:thiamine phosphate synthase [Candidatus Polarisedimenticolia bacterium]
MNRPHEVLSPGVCFVTDGAATAGRPLLEVVRSAVAGGADLIQLREKDRPGGALLDLAKGVVAICRESGWHCRVIVNDRLDVALAAKAAGIHLPAAGLPVDGVRRLAGKRFLVGRSVHSLAEAQKAQKEGADYIIFGPVFATPGKAAFGEPLGPAALRRAAESLRIPVWAIGGIDPATAAELAGMPIAGVAAIRAIAAAPDPAGAVRALRAALGRTPVPP